MSKQYTLVVNEKDEANITELAEKMGVTKAELLNKALSWAHSIVNGTKILVDATPVK